MTVNRKIIQSIVSVLVALGVYCWAQSYMPEAARRVLAIFVGAALFWILEIIPLYATSLSAVVLLILTIGLPGGVLAMDATGYTAFLMPFASPVIMLFFGGLVLAQAFSKYQLDQIAAAKAMVIFGNKPFGVLCGFVAVTAFLSMWMSNTAVAAMMLALIRPLIVQIEANDPFRKALVLAIPFAANIGGIGTPIGTPPNAIALGALLNQGVHISFLSWMLMAVPLMLVILCAVVFILRSIFPARCQEVRWTWAQTPRMSVQGKIVGIVCAATVALWLTSELHRIPSAVVALLAVGVLSLTGVINRDDFKRIDWDVLILMWGGLALGKGLELSGLSQWMVELPIFQQQGFGLIVVFALFTIVVSTFLSNTATANMIIPIAMAVHGGAHTVLAVTVGLCCSFAMALPISTPPNALAFSSGAVHGRDMFLAGLLVSLVCLGAVILGALAVFHQWVIFP